MKIRTILLFTLLFAVTLLCYGLFFKTEDVENIDSVPCTKPLVLRTGELDDRFQIDQATLENALREVAMLWSSAMGEPVVVYRDDAELLVHLVYAEEQQLTDSERQFRDRLRSESLTIEVMEKRFNEQEAVYGREAREYEHDMEKLQLTINRLNQWVNNHNRNGGLNEEELRQYEYQKASVEKATNALKRKEEELKKDAETLHRMLSDLNRQIGIKNDLVDEYNRRFTRERTFTQGAYEWNEAGKSIQVFQFSSLDELKLVLAHEVGHALGLAHVDNPTSVMYYLMEDQRVHDLELSEEDIVALKALCSESVRLQE